MRKTPVKGIKLEVDPSIIEKNLDFKLNTYEGENDGDGLLSRLFPKPSPDDDIPWKPVVPTPGYVAKCKTVEGDKIFLNICHTSEIAPPADISDAELNNMLESDDVPSYKIPTSIGDLHIETDKSGNLASAYDIAVNPAFYEKIRKNELFRTFFNTVIMEAIQNKYNLQLDMKTGLIMLKNKKCCGKLQTHRIKQLPGKIKPKKLIEELPDPTPSKVPTLSMQSKHGNNISSHVHTESSALNGTSSLNPCSNFDYKVDSENRLKIILLPEEPKKLIAFISIAALSGSELELDVGEDRILVKSPRKNDVVDFFLPYSIDQKFVDAKYFVNNQTLRIDFVIKSM